MIHSATAIWRGRPASGLGSVSSSSGVISNTPYFFASGSNEPCTTPGEMLAAAHASCIAMMFAQETARVGLTSEKVTTKTDLKIEEVNSLWTITNLHVDVVVYVANMSEETFAKVTEKAKLRCAITRALQVKTTINASFVAPEPRAAAARA